VARPLGIPRQAAAFGVIRIANAQLVQSIRTLCVARGLDVREMALVAFGGAGPLYGGMIARELGMREVIVPRHPGVFAAEGLLAADIRHIAQRPFGVPVAGLDPAQLRQTLASMRAAVDAELAADGIGEERRRYQQLGDLRYCGQFHEIVMPVPDYLTEPWDGAALARDFHAAHAALYGHADHDAPVEIVNLRMAGIGLIDRPAAQQDRTGRALAAAVPASTRPVYLGDGAAHRQISVYHRDGLRPGHRLEGPAIVTQTDSTTVVLAGQSVTVEAGGILRMRDGLSPEVQ
jgi:N-methylhydantoinase A